MRASEGSVDAELGGRLIKQRVARAGKGRSGGYRTLIAFHGQTRSVFLYGFAKSEAENIGEGELYSLRKLAARLLSLSDDELDLAVAEGELTELEHGGEKAQN